MSATPNPGTAEARDLGCTCATIDNHYGRGYHGQAGVFVITGGCPLHAPSRTPLLLGSTSDGVESATAGGGAGALASRLPEGGRA